ncbi:hypothetical protein EOPP23_20480 [Endozoicomonas sp. OPT23]|uniref:lytic transglycosylase domain-containing protein n=1 Tax=Endozoicomonas sp. OPT23 TaxID=2072845 RepID=UPI00129A696F|nr:lytic transglycosylase domain-containing protein [Endozoicomonas sp. OPT23]MRI35339.1 hypothetical protein [Endozoicomonas sp. OPT23]
MILQTFLKSVWPDNSVDNTDISKTGSSLAGYLLKGIVLPALLASSFATAQPKQIDLALKEQLTDSVNADSFIDRFAAEVWLVDMSGRLKSFIPNREKRLRLLRLIHREAILADLSPEMVLALIQTESSFNRFAISSAGAQGLMQVMPFWKNVIGRPEDNLTDVATNLRYGSTILSYYLEKEKGNMTRALARYNGSLGKIWYPERVYNNWDKNWRNE